MAAGLLRIVLLSLLGGAVALELSGGWFTLKAQPQRPFNVYRSGTYCVFVAGTGMTANVAVVPIGAYDKCE